MKSFIINYINTALFINLIFSIIISLFLKLIITNSYTLNSKSLELTDEEYFILNNRFDFKKIFYFITYKLYKRGILELKMNQGKFYYTKSTSNKLTDIESEVSQLYINGFSPKEFNSEMIDKKIFIEYFDSLYKNLILNKFIKSKHKLIFDKVLFILGFLIILIPEIIILAYTHGLFLSKIFMNLFISTFIYIFILKNYILTKFTGKAIKANEQFKKRNPYYSNKLIKNNCSNEMDKFLLQNIYMYYFDDDIDDSNDDNEDFAST